MERLGPFVVDMSGETLFNALLRLSNQSISKRILKQAFRSNFVFLNGTRLTAGSRDELITANEGDVLRIERDVKALNLTSIEKRVVSTCNNINILYCDSSVAFVLKESGISTGPDSVYDRAVLNQLLSRTSIHYYKALYTLTKGVRGIIIYSSTPDIHKKLLSSAASSAIPHIMLRLRCVVCGLIAESGTSIDLNIDHHTCSALKIDVISVSRCTSTEYLSLITITPIFEKSRLSENDDFSSSKYLSDYLKYIKHALRSIKHPIVGDVNMVKKSKGIFFTLLEVDVSQVIPLAPVVRVEDPIKFSKVLFREQMYWERNKDKCNNLLKAWEDEKRHLDLNMDESNSDTNDDSDDEALEPSIESERNPSGMPVEYIIGRAKFCDLEFEVNPDVMIPRKSSETLVMAAMDIYEKVSIHHNDIVRVIDIGIGSGNLLLSFLHKTAAFNKSNDIKAVVKGFGIDLSTKALTIASKNSARLGICECEFLAMDMNEIVTRCSEFNIDPCKGLFDVIFCNPPYSSSKELYRISSSRRDYEPAMALFAPIGPLECYHSLAKTLISGISQGLHVLRHGGHLVLEVGHGQDIAVASIIENIEGYKLVRKVKDYKDIVRALVFQATWNTSA